MSPQSKPVAAGHPELVRGGNVYRLAIVGAGTLKGKEVAEVLSDRNFPSLDIKLLDEDDALGQLEALGDEVSFIQSVRTEQFEKIDFTFFAADPEATRRIWKTARKGGSAIVDLSFALEDEPDAVVRSPWIERQRGRTITLDLQPGPSVVAHPAAIVLGLLLLRAQKAGEIKRAVATVFEPASERGQKGMDELHEQTVNLLSFQQMPKNVYDTQVAFNMVARYGEEAVPALATVEQRIVRHYQEIVGKSAPLPSVMLVQAPIFHGHAFSLYLEMGAVANIATLAQALAGDHISMTLQAEDAPSNVNAAGQNDVLVSIVPDANHENGLWLWVASDNLRITATTAVECAETMVATRPRGKIQ